MAMMRKREYCLRIGSGCFLRPQGFRAQVSACAKFKEDECPARV